MRVTWRRVIPAARRSPTSRARSATVIESVLKIRNAPPNRATAATRATATRISAVAASSAAATSSGALTVYGSNVRRCSREAVALAASVPSASRTSTAVTRSVAKSACAASSGTTTLRAAGSGSPGVATRTPTTVNAVGGTAGSPSSVIVAPTPRPSSRARSAEMSAPWSSPVPSGAPAASVRSWIAGSAARTMPTTVRGAGRAVAASSGSG